MNDMPCHITDQWVFNPLTDDDGFLDVEPEPPVVHLDDYSAAELFGQSHTIWIEKNGGDYTLELSNDDDETIVHKTSSCAMDNFADFCENFLKRYNKARGEV